MRLVRWSLALTVTVSGCATAPARPRVPPHRASAALSPELKVVVEGPVQVDDPRFTASRATPAAAAPRLWISRERDCSDGFDVEGLKTENGVTRWSGFIVEPGRVLCGSSEAPGELAYLSSLPVLPNPGEDGPRMDRPPTHRLPRPGESTSHDEAPGTPGSERYAPGQETQYPLGH